MSWGRHVPAGRLVGRREEVELLLAVLRAGPGRAVVVGGEAGVGKTRLAQTVAALWAEDDNDVEWLTAAPGTSAIPFGAVVRLLPEVPAAAAEPVVGREADLVRAAVSAARQKPDRLVVVDDGHQLDDLSALLVHHLVLDRSAPVLITVRTGEPVPPPLGALWRDHHADRVDVLPLSKPETTELAGELLPGEIDDATAEALFDSSGGNALLLGELVRDALDAGRLSVVDGCWQWDGQVGRGRRLRTAIASRLDALPEPGRLAVALLALAEPLSLTMLRRLVPGLAAEEIEQRGVIRVHEAGGRVEARLAHPLFGEVVLAERGPEELAALRRAVADAIAATGGHRREDLLLEAQLRLDADDQSTFGIYLAAANHGIALGALDLARRMAAAAERAGAPPVARILYAETLLLDRREAEAIEVIEQVVDDLTTDADRVRAAQCVQHAHHLLGDRAMIDASIGRFGALVGDPAWKGVLEGNAIQYVMMTGRTREATRRGADLLGRQDDPRIRVRLVSSVASGWAIAGRTSDSLAYVGDVLGDALRLQDELPLGPMWVMNAQALSLLIAGRLDDAVGFIDMLRALVDARQHAGVPMGGPAWLLLFSGRIDLARGNAPAAAHALGRAADTFGDDDVGGFYRWARSLEAEALALGGDVGRAGRAAAAASAALSRHAVYEGDATRARAWVAAVEGEISRAIDALLAVAEAQRDEGQFGLEIYTLHDAVRLGAGPDASEHLAAALEHTDGLWSDAFRASVDGRRTGRGHDLETAGDRFAAMGANLHAAEAMALAARAFEAEALRTRAAAAARRRDELLALCHGARTPALHDLPARAELTRREREVVTLAAQGLSNRAIAERLVVSVRTAEGHLHRAFTKLGVTDRSELAAVLDAATTNA